MLGRFRRKSGGHANPVKVLFELEQDDSGFPPETHETLWAIPTDGGYRLDNVPFFAKGVAYGDVVAGSLIEGDNIGFSSVVRPSGHSTCRVVLVDDDADVKAARRIFEELGCSTELSHLSGYFAVDVPAEVAMSDVLAILEAGQADDRWDFDVGVFGDR
jgi:hypothetical protein